MPETMPTIAEFAKTLGVSKSTVVNNLKALHLETVTDPTDRRGRRLLPQRTCAVLADRLAETAQKASKADGPSPTAVDLARLQNEALRSANETLERQVDTLIRQLDAAESSATEVGRQAQARIDELKSQVERLETENRDLKAQLALSRALEGFHWPWTRDKIKAQYLLPPTTESL